MAHLPTHSGWQPGRSTEAVLQAIEEHALTKEAIEAVIQLSERDDVQDAKTGLERERKDIEKRIANIMAAIEADGMGSLLRRLRELEDRLAAIDEQLRNLQPIPRSFQRSSKTGWPSGGGSSASPPRRAGPFSSESSVGGSSSPHG
jgi:hypothetical protein